MNSKRHGRKSTAPARVSSALLLACSSVAASPPLLEGNRPPPPGEVVAVGFEGLGFGTATERADPVVEHWVPWGQVIDPGSGWREAAGRYAAVWDPAWRARERVARGDAAGAEPLYEDLFEIYAGRTDPTAIEVAAGLTLTRLLRGARYAALEPWLASVFADEVHRRDSSTPTPAAESAATTTLSGQPTRLRPGLPPFFDAEASAARAVERVRVLGWLDPDLAPASTSLHRLYLAGFDKQPAPRALFTSDPDIRFVALLLDAAFGEAAPEHAGPETHASAEPSAKEAAIDALERLARDQGALEPWAEAWSLYALGVGLTASADHSRRLDGVVYLLRLAALLPDTEPALTRSGVLLAADTLETLGDDSGASRLREEAGLLQNDERMAR